MLRIIAKISAILWILVSLCMLISLAIARIMPSAVIAVTAMMGANSTLLMIDPQRQQILTIYTASQSGETIGQFVWSPDGYHFALEKVKDVIEYYAYAGAMGRPIRQIYGGTILTHTLSWSPDGRWLSLITWPSADLQLVQIDGTPLAVDRSQLYHEAATWFTDGRLGYSLHDEETGLRALHIFTPPNTTQAITSMKRSYRQAGWSPDGRYVVYLGDMNGQTQPYLMNIETQEITSISLGAYHGLPVWSPDGRYVALTVQQGVEQVAYILDTSTVQATRLITGSRVGDYVWSSDSAYLAFSVNYGGGKRLYLTPIKPTIESPAPLAPLNLAYPVQWSPDGRWLAYIADVPGTQALYILDVTTMGEALIWQWAGTSIVDVDWRP